LNYGLCRAFGRKAWKLTEYSALNPTLAGSAAFRRHLRMLDYDPTYRPHASQRHLAEFVLRRGDYTGLWKKVGLARFGVETRDPTADRRLIEFSLSLPTRMWLRDGTTKWLYRQAFRGLVPDAVMNLKLRGYQGADWPERLRRSWNLLSTEARLAAANPVLTQLIDEAYLQEMAHTPLPTDLSGDKTLMYYRLKGLRAISVAHFVRKTIPVNEIKA
jgi:asparagine synthase (glutamine-hydrolysing)